LHVYKEILAKKGGCASKSFQTSKSWLIKQSLDDLEAAEAFQASNRMSIEMLLNPVDKWQNIDETPDKDICKAVLKAEKDMQVDGGRDCNDNEVVEACSMCHEAVKAMLLINRYIDGMDDSFA